MTTTWLPIVDPGQLKDFRLRLLLAHWSAAAAKRGQPPSKEFVDKTQLGDLLDWIFLYRVERDPLRFLYILCGAKISRRIGVSLTGKYVHDHPNPEVRDGITASLTAAVTSGVPHRVESHRRLLDREMLTEVVVAPLAGSDGIVDHVLALQILDIGDDA